MKGSRRRPAQVSGTALDFLAGLVIGVCLAAACAGAATPSAPDPLLVVTPAAAAIPGPAQLSPAPALIRTTAPQPALTSMAVALRALTITPSSAGPRPAATKTPVVGQLEIIVGDYYFNPQVVTVTVGTTVTWVPEGVLYHTIVSKASPPVFRGGTTGLGSPNFKYVFRRPGVYEYHCDYHPGAMNASLIVVDDD